jgi:YHS domain-containing protein
MKSLAFILAALFLSTIGFAQNNSEFDSWKVVSTENVCMVTEVHFGTPQIPVVVDGKTYYGCCAMCKKTLTENKSTREALDPLTKKVIDKATATIAANGEGKVLYFESQKNFDDFMKKTK